METLAVEQEQQTDASSIPEQPLVRRGKRARAVPVVNVRTEHRKDCYGVDESGKRLKAGKLITKGCKWSDSTRNSCSCPKLLIWSENGKRHKEAAGLLLVIEKWGDLFRKLSKAAALKDENGNAMDFHSHMLRDTFAQWCFLNDLSTEDVAALLGHANIQITQQHYAPFMIARQKRLTNRVKDAHLKSQRASVGATSR